MSGDDYIIITGSRNLDDDGEGDENTKKEGEDSSRRVLEGQGIFLDQEGDTPTSTEPHDEFSKKLQELSGIEIIQNEDTDAED